MVPPDSRQSIVVAGWPGPQGFLEGIGLPRYPCALGGGGPMNFSEWWNPGATQEAALEADIAKDLWEEVDERRKNAWLRPIGFVTRILIYACCFGVLLFFMPEGLSEGWVFSRPFSGLTLSDVLGSLVWILIAIKLGHALFNPNPRPDFREQLGWVGVGLIILTVFPAIVVYVVNLP
jgi:hypothetical protein